LAISAASCPGRSKALQPRHRRGEGRRKRELLDLSVEFVPPLQLVGERHLVLSKHHAIGRRQWRRLAR
jgi:hypothetical protein